MCNHSVIEFIGRQECVNGDTLPLYNCLECRTTIALSESDVTGSALLSFSHTLVHKNGYYSRASLSSQN